MRSYRMRSCGGVVGRRYADSTGGEDAWWTGVRVQMAADLIAKLVIGVLRHLLDLMDPSDGRDDVSCAPITDPSPASCANEAIPLST